MTSNEESNDKIKLYNYKIKIKNKRQEKEKENYKIIKLIESSPSLSTKKVKKNLRTPVHEFIVSSCQPNSLRTYVEE